MSLINQMLRDLDRREASAAERTGVSVPTRALPPRRRFSWSRLLLVFGGAAVALLLWTSLWPSIESQPWRRAEPVAAAPRVAVVAAPATAVAPAPAVTPAARPVPDAAEPAPAVPAPPKGAAKPPVRRDARPEPAEPAEPPAPPAPEPGPAVLAPAAPAAAATIDKRPLGQAAGESAESAETEYRRGMAAYRQGQSAQAMARLQSALALDRQHGAARQALLSMAVAQRRWAEAQTLASEGLALDAAQTGWAMTLARLQFEQGDMAGAERTLAAHRRYGEHSPDYLAFHGLLLEKLDRRDEARAAFLKARASGELTPALAGAIEQRLR